MMAKRRPCPCGKTPTELLIYESSGDKTPKWAFVLGGCCGEWHIEYRNNYKDIDGPEAMELAEAAWDAAPRVS